MSKEPLVASCLCGQIKINFREDIKLGNVDICHCSMCRKWGGGPFFAVSCGDELTIEGEEAIVNYQSSAWAERGFCQHCGTHLYYHLKKPAEYLLTAGLFDNPGELKLSTEIFIDEKPKFYCFGNETRKLTGEDVFAQFGESLSSGED